MPNAADGMGDSTSKNNCAVLAKAITWTFEDWQLSDAHRQLLLGVDPNSRETLDRYAKGGPLIDTRDLLDRASYLLGIYKELRPLYPETPVRAG